VRRVDEAIVVCPEAQERLERIGLPEGRCTVVRNTPDPASLVRNGRQAPILKEWEDRFIVLFSGLLAGDRGLDTAIEAMQRLEAQRPSRFCLLIVGDGPVQERLEALTRKKGLEDCIRFLGRVPYSELGDLISGCSLGILPFRQCPHIDSSLANKLFEYMSLGLPVVASDVPPHRRVIEDAGNGLLSEPGSPEALARAILACEEDPKQLAEFARAGQRAVLEGYSWAHDGERLVEVVSRFAPQA
ncbi:MAG: glycosyltransferase family 4 protein, partial [Myxococcota bacterium]|nr:glycosyltransferase family 4 protein [Myxococcota bacterium]